MMGFERPADTGGVQRGGLALLCICLLATLTACGPAVDESAPNPPDKLRAVVIPVLFTAPFYIAQAEGYFADENLEVEFVRLTRNIDAIPALAQGDVDIGGGQVTIAMLNAMSGGARIRIVAGTGHLAADGCSFHGFVVQRGLLPDGGELTADGLRGRRVEVDITLPHAYWLHTALQPLGLDIDDLEVVDVPMQALVDAFLNDAFDFTGLTEPRLSALLQSGQAVLWRGAEDIVPDYPQNVLFFGRSLLDERPEVGERFMRAYRRAIRQYNEGKTARNVEILAEATRLSREQLETMCWVSMDDDARIRFAGFDGYQQWAMGQGLVERVMPEGELVDRRFGAAAAGAR